MSIIKNKKELLKENKDRADILNIIEAGYQAISIESIIKNKISFSKGILKVENEKGKTNKIDIKNKKSVYVFGIGKGSYSAISYIVDVLKSKNVSGAIALDVDNSPKPKKPNKAVKVFYGTHPKPSLKNISATSKILEILNNLDKDDFVIYFIGGGGSALLCSSLSEYRNNSKIFSELTKKGAPIEEMNVVRKHFSKVKGGGLAKYTYPSEYVSLVVSDVPGDNIDIIASAPTVYDKTTIKDAKKILRKYKIKFNEKDLIETPKERKYFSKNYLIATNKDALLSMKDEAKRLGYKVKIFSDKYSGDSKKALLKLSEKVKKGEVIIAGGETTTKLCKNPGGGGRNQESVLGVLLGAYDAKINMNNLYVSSVASDGKDNVNVAGALADSKIMKEIIDKDLDIEKHLSKNDSFNFFKKVGGHIRVDVKNFNVSDLMVILKK